MYKSLPLHILIINRQLTKSKTIGVVSHEGKTRFNKIILMAEAEIEEGEDSKEAYKQLSEYIEKCFKQESNIK